LTQPSRNEGAHDPKGWSSRRSRKARCRRAAGRIGRPPSGIGKSVVHRMKQRIDREEKEAAAEQDEGE
jgi:hypothetical protein